MSTDAGTLEYAILFAVLYGTLDLAKVSILVAAVYAWRVRAYSTALLCVLLFPPLFANSVWNALSQVAITRNMALAGTGVANSNDILAPLDVIAACQFQNRHLVERWQCEIVEAVQAFDGREPGGLDPAFDHAPFTIDHLQLGQPHQVTRMVDAFCGTQLRLLVILAQERRQFERLQVVRQQDLLAKG